MQCFACPSTLLISAPLKPVVFLAYSPQKCNPAPDSSLPRASICIFYCYCRYFSINGWGYCNPRLVIWSYFYYWHFPHPSSWCWQEHCLLYSLSCMSACKFCRNSFFPSWSFPSAPSLPSSETFLPRSLPWITTINRKLTYPISGILWVLVWNLSIKGAL